MASCRALHLLQLCDGPGLEVGVDNRVVDPADEQEVSESPPLLIGHAGPEAWPPSMAASICAISPTRTPSDSSEADYSRDRTAVAGPQIEVTGRLHRRRQPLRLFQLPVLSAGHLLTQDLSGDCAKGLMVIDLVLRARVGEVNPSQGAAFTLHGPTRVARSANAKASLWLQ